MCGKTGFQIYFKQSRNALVEFNSQLHCNIDLPRYFKPEGSHAMFYTITTTTNLPEFCLRAHANTHKMSINSINLGNSGKEMVRPWPDQPYRFHCLHYHPVLFLEYCTNFHVKYNADCLEIAPIFHHNVDCLEYGHATTTNLLGRV